MLAGQHRERMRRAVQPAAREIEAHVAEQRGADLPLLGLVVPAARQQPRVAARAHYVLKEAELGGGKRLGPVGGHIVAEVFVGLLAHDPSSWLHSRPTWKPFLGRHGGTFTMADLIKFTGYGLEGIVLPPPVPVPTT